MEEKHIAAIDLGSSKFAVAVARISGDDIQIVYYKETPSDGIRNSEVFNPGKTLSKLGAAIHEAEQELSIKIMQACVGLPRYPVTQEVATARFDRSEPNRCISDEEIDTLKSLALEAYPLNDPDGEVLYGAVAQSFSTAEYLNLVEHDVVGTVSRSLEGNFKVFIGRQHAVTDIDVLFNNLHIAIARMYFLPDAIAKAVLTSEELENGVALIDFGGGVTSVSIYHGNIMRYYGAIPFGGKTITNDIKTECSISESLADNIKKGFGSCMPSKLQNLSEKTLQIQYEDRNNIEVRVSYLAEVIGERTREIVDAILWHIQRSGFEKSLNCGIVITGGGANLMGLSYLIKERSGYNVKLGYPRHLFSADGCIGIYETSATAAMGMILAAKNDRLPDCVDQPAFNPDLLRGEGLELETAFPEETEEAAEPVAEQPETAEETPHTDWDTDFNQGTQGTLIEATEFGEPVKREKPRRNFSIMPRTRARASEHINLIWKKVTDRIGDIYDNATKED